MQPIDSRNLARACDLAGALMVRMIEEMQREMDAPLGADGDRSPAKEAQKKELFGTQSMVVNIQKLVQSMAVLQRMEAAIPAESEREPPESPPMSAQEQAVYLAWMAQTLGIDRAAGGEAAATIIDTQGNTEPAGEGMRVEDG